MSRSTACAVLVVLLLCGNRVAAAAPLEQLLAQQGQVAFCDGSSIYRLHKDHRFELEPVGVSGRAIRGVWQRRDASFFVVTGKWEWVNGVSPADDYRRMVLHVNALPGKPVVVGARRVSTVPVYLTIEELTRVTRQAYEQARKPR